MELQQNNYLTWQQAQVDAHVSTPVAMRQVMPEWWSNLPGNLSQATQGCPHQDILQMHDMKSVKFCRGLQGARNLGYTIALDRDIMSHIPHDQETPWHTFYANVRDQTWPDCDNEQDFHQLPKHVQQECIQVHGYRPQQQQSTRLEINGPRTLLSSFLHPEMLQGTMWNQRDSSGQYLYNMILVHWPWRAKMPPGWRMLIMANQFDWSPDYHVFTGCPDANWATNSINNAHSWEFDILVDSDFNYFNIDLVVAVAAGKTIPKGKCIFSMVPVYDPDYVPSSRKKYPKFTV